MYIRINAQVTTHNVLGGPCERLDGHGAVADVVELASRENAGHGLRRGHPDERHGRRPDRRCVRLVPVGQEVHGQDGAELREVSPQRPVGLEAELVDFSNAENSPLVALGERVQDRRETHHDPAAVRSRGALVRQRRVEVVQTGRCHALV